MGRIGAGDNGPEIDHLPQAEKAPRPGIQIVDTEMRFALTRLRSHVTARVAVDARDADAGIFHARHLGHNDSHGFPP